MSQVATCAGFRQVIDSLTCSISGVKFACAAGVPHKSTEDDEYKGFFIPKGTLVFPNAWSAYCLTTLASTESLCRAILHNPDDYPEPEEFIPERYLKRTADGQYEIDKSVRDPRTVAFGFGRRYIHSLTISAFNHIC
jgi:hypothetical protein